MPSKPRKLGIKETEENPPAVAPLTPRSRNRKKPISQDKPQSVARFSSDPVDLSGRLFSLINTQPNATDEIHDILHELNLAYEIGAVVQFSSDKQQELDAQPTESMSNGDEPPPLVSKEKIQGRFTVAADEVEVGETLKAFRKDAGLTQSDIADELGTTHQAILKLEKGHHSPSIKTIKGVAKALGYSVYIEFVPD